MWWNRKEEGSSNNNSDNDQHDDIDSDTEQPHNTTTTTATTTAASEEAAAGSSSHRTSSVPSKKTRVGGTSRQSFLGSKSLTSHRRSRRNNNNKSLGGNSSHSFAGSSNNNNLTAEGRNNNSTVAETHMGFEVSLTSLEQQQQQQQGGNNSNNMGGGDTPQSSSNHSRKHSHRDLGKSTSSSHHHHHNNKEHHHHHHKVHHQKEHHHSNNHTSSNSSAQPKDLQSSSSPSSVMKPVISLQEELISRQKVNRTQYNMAQWPALGPRPKNATAGLNRNRSRHSGGGGASGKPIKLSRHHRVQFTGGSTSEKDGGGGKARANSTSFEDCLFLLRSHEVVDEMTSLKEEIEHMNAELDALHKDKARLEEITNGGGGGSNSSLEHNNNSSSSLQQQSPAAVAASPPQLQQSPGGGDSGGGAAANSNTATAAASSSTTNNNNTATAWDVNELLGSKSITVAQRSQLQMQRGVNLTVSFHDRNACEALATRCGVKPHVLAKLRDQHKQQQKLLLQQQQSMSSVAASATGDSMDTTESSRPLPQLAAATNANTVSKPQLLELSLETCREGGAATYVQHISLLCKPGGAQVSFFLGKDQGKSVYWGHLPDRLFRRMRDSGQNPKQSASELAYLATGPMDYYYAEFRSGEAWWGSAVEDRAFHSICTEWDVYRVVFGPSLILDEVPSDVVVAAAAAAAAAAATTGNSEQDAPQQQQQQQQEQSQQQHQAIETSSWVILSRDGRAAWKNLPSRLDHLLQSRMADQAGLAEISLGCGDSYFCRFLDGTVDYCLPSTLAQVCQDLELRGSTITNICLHPELSHCDFCIRSSNNTTI